MAVLTLRAEWAGNARVKVYPRIGGGARVKSFGFQERRLRVDGICLWSDLAVLEASFALQTPQWLRAPLTGGHYRWFLIVIAGQPAWRPAGGGYIDWWFEGVVV